MELGEPIKNVNWAEEIALENELPPRTEKIEGNKKIVTEFKKVDNTLFKCIRTYRIEKKLVNKNIKLRKSLKKFGDSENDKAGPNEKTTIIGDDVFIQFISNKEEDKHDDDDRLKLLSDKRGLVKCRNCGGDHWTTNCPSPIIDKNLAVKKTQDLSTDTTNDTVNKNANSTSTATNKYVPPNLRDGAGKRIADTSSLLPKRDDATAIRISNLSESTTESDLEELARPFGDIFKIYLAKDRNTGLCKGFAYVHYKKRESAANAIAVLNGHGYDHLILDVDWSKPQA